MIRPIIAVFVFIAAFGVSSATAQQPASFKNFASFRNIVPGIDFFASNRQAIAPYEKPTAETMAKLRELFGNELPKGAIFICSTLEQKDSIYEPKVLKMGYSWTLKAETPAVRSQQMLERIKSRMGDNVPAELLDRMKNMPSDMTANFEKQMIASMTQQIAYAILQTMLSEGLQFRSSRLDDMGKSPLPDWLDIGIASYVSGNNSALAFLQQNMDQSFPLEDVLSMARPFVANFSDQNGGGFGGGMPSMGGGNGRQRGGMPGSGGGGMPNFGGGGMPNFGGGGMNGSGGPGGMRGGAQRTLPKDEQDRMLFDGQASTFFCFIFEKIGLEKIRELIKEAREGKESRDYLGRTDVLGTDFQKIETDWAAWVKAQKAEMPVRPN
ncbi:MAG: hypothetical protein QUT30_16095 [Acidobacteriota bacterium]|nr:hypothetical protein [Acidobacteriota bacterium]